MADNYLEKRLDDYRSRPPRPMATPKATRAVMVPDGLSPRGTAAVKRLSAIPGCKVAFCGLPASAGARLAQATASRYYPIDPADTEALARAVADAQARWHLGVEIVD